MFKTSIKTISFIMFLLPGISTLFLFNPISVGAQEGIQKLTGQLNKLEKNIENMGNRISEAHISGNQEEIVSIDGDINDLNSQIDDLKRSIRDKRNVPQSLRDKADNLWNDVQNQRQDLREVMQGNAPTGGPYITEEHLRGRYNELYENLTKANELGFKYTRSDKPCGCDLAGVARMLEKLAAVKPEINDKIDKLAWKAKKQWEKLLKKVGKEAGSLKPDMMTVAGKQILSILTAAAFDALDVGLEKGAEAYLARRAAEKGTGSVVGGIAKGVEKIEKGVKGKIAGHLAAGTGRKVVTKVAGKTNAIKGGIERVAGGEAAEKLQKRYPELSKIDETYNDMMAWKGLANRYKRQENDLWKRLMNNSDCMKRISQTPCKIKGISEKDLAGAGQLDSYQQALAATQIIGESLKDARILSAGLGCDDLFKCKIFNELKKLKDLRDIADDNIRDLNKGIRDNMKSQLFINTLMMKGLSRDGSPETFGWGYTGFTLGASILAPFAGGTAVAIGEAGVNMVDNYIKKGMGENLQGNIKGMKRNLKLYIKPLKAWNELAALIRQAEIQWMRALNKCALNFDCGDDEGGKPVPDAVGEPDQPDYQWKVNVDESTWCSYWIWETPTGKNGPGKRPSGGWFTPEKPGKPKQPKGPVSKKPKDGKVPLILETPPPPPVPEERENGPTVVYYPEEEVDEDVPAKEPPPVLIVKAKRDTLKNGKIVSESVANAQIKLSFLAPDLPLGDAEKDDKGFDKDPVQGITNEKGELVLKTDSGSLSAENRRKQVTTSPSRLARFWDMISPGTASVYAAPAKGKSSHKPLKVEINIPKFESHILKININKREKNWEDPSSYLGSALGSFVVRKWIVEQENCMYVVVNIPE